MPGVSISVHGDREVRDRLRGAWPRVWGRIVETVTTWTYKLQRRVELKLSGEVLQNRTGTLRRSITAKVEQDALRVRGIVGTNLEYAAIHEYGGVIHLPEIRPVTAKALHWTTVNGVSVFATRVRAHDVTMPERSYLRSSLAELKDEFQAAVREAGRV